MCVCVCVCERYRGSGNCLEERVNFLSQTSSRPALGTSEAVEAESVKVFVSCPPPFSDKEPSKTKNKTKNQQIKTIHKNGTIVQLRN